MPPTLQSPATATPPSFSPVASPLPQVDDALVSRARSLGAMIRAHADATERDRRLAPPVLAAMRDSGFFRMFTPRALGGLEVDPVTMALVVEEIALHDSAAAWAMQAGNAGAWWASRLPEAGVAEVFADGPDLVMAATFMPPQPAEAVEGGYRLDGRGALASTVHDAPWVLMTGLVTDGGQPRMTPSGPALVSLVLPTREVEIVDTWRSLGMRGTDSNDIVAHGVFVPESRSYPLVPAFTPSAPFRGPLYRMPGSASVTVVIAPIALAIARGAIEELRALADRRVPLGSQRTMRHRTSVQSALAEAEALLRAARLYYYEELIATWRSVTGGAVLTLEERADIMLAATHATQAATRVVELMHRACGTAGIYARSRLERHFRDAETVRHHGLVCEARLETVGQVYLGVEPEFALVAF